MTAGAFPSLLAARSGYSAFNGGAGAETSTQIATRMLAADSQHGKATIIWAGRNNPDAPATVQADIAAMVASLKHTHYVVLSILNGDYANEYTGQSGYAAIASLNAALAATYGSHFIDVRSYLVSLYNPAIPQDVIDHARDVPPSSLRIDQLHLSDTGLDYVAAKVYESWPILRTP